MKKKKKQTKKTKPKKVEEDLILLEMPEWDSVIGEPEEDQYNYRCQECSYEEFVPGFIIDEFAEDDERDFFEWPVLECPRCPGAMVFCDNKKKE